MALLGPLPMLNGAIWLYSATEGDKIEPQILVDAQYMSNHGLIKHRRKLYIGLYISAGRAALIYV